MGRDDMWSLGVSCSGSVAGSHDDKLPYSSPVQYENPSWIVAGRGRMVCEVDVVQRPAEAIASLLAGSLSFMVTIGVGRLAESLLNLLFELSGLS